MNLWGVPVSNSGSDGFPQYASKLIFIAG